MPFTCLQVWSSFFFFKYTSGIPIHSHYLIKKCLDTMPKLKQNWGPWITYFFVKWLWPALNWPKDLIEASHHQNPKMSVLEDEVKIFGMNWTADCEPASPPTSVTDLTNWLRFLQTLQIIWKTFPEKKSNLSSELHSDSQSYIRWSQLAVIGFALKYLSFLFCIASPVAFYSLYSPAFWRFRYDTCRQWSEHHRS